MISFRSYPKEVQERVNKDAKLSALVLKEVGIFMSKWITNACFGMD